MPCDQVKEFLHQHEVPFDEIRVGDATDAFDRIREHTGGAVGTPTVVIDDEARIGFDPTWMARELGLEPSGD